MDFPVGDYDLLTFCGRWSQERLPERLPLRQGMNAVGSTRGFSGARYNPAAILLSPDATVKAVPRLEIYADDVKCAHGSAIGSLNQDQLYYLRTRGIDEADARALLTRAFLDEVFDSIEEEEIREDFKRLAVFEK